MRNTLKFEENEGKSPLISTSLMVFQCVGVLLRKSLNLKGCA